MASVARLRCLLLASAVLGLAAAPPAEPGTDLGRRVDRLVEKHVKPDGPGAAVLVVRHGKVLHSKGYGLADLKNRTPVTPQTVFDLASVSKQFTAMAVMILHDRGKLHFTDDARQYLPELKEHDPKRPIRIRDLLHHTSGLPDYPRFVDVTPTTTNEDVLQAIAKRKLAFPTGTKHRYCNTGYVLLALVVERASGKPFPAFLHDEVFAPLQMEHTVVCAGPARTPDRARGYGKGKDKKLEPWHGETLVCGDGSVFTTLEDMARWDAGLRAGQLVKPPTLRLAWIAGKLDNGKDVGYGFGWGIERPDGKLVVWHNGEWGGFTTSIRRDVDADLTVVVLTNCDEYDAGALGDEIADLCLAHGK